MVSQEPAKLSNPQGLSGFESRWLRHVAVVQLVEHQIVALVVADSSSASHPKSG